MSSKVISITSTSHFKQMQSSNTYLIVDFYADWCGPCKTIAPIFEQLAATETKPGRLAFVKVNVDNQRDVASIYGISAMPTFLVIKGTRTVETVRGANPSALRTAVLSAATDAAKGPARQSVAFSGQGQKLGAEAGGSSSGGGGGAGGAGGRTIGGGMGSGFNLGQYLSGPAALAGGSGIMAMITRFLGLYVSTLFSFDPIKTAEDSPFSVRRGSNIKTR